NNQRRFTLAGINPIRTFQPSSSRCHDIVAPTTPTTASQQKTADRPPQQQETIGRKSNLRFTHTATQTSICVAHPPASRPTSAD
ncbi:hypothetical protein ANTRET_LOCUS11041, partial [Anthophora retusa]